MEPSNLLVVCLGMGTVFFGLICLIAICSVMGAICKSFVKAGSSEKEVAKSAIENKQEIVAVCCGVIAEELGTEVKNIKVLSFKRI